MLSGIIPMDYIGYLGLLSQMVEKVHFSTFDHGLFEFSTSPGESLNVILAAMDKNSNNDWDELPRKGNLSGLKKMDAIDHPKRKSQEWKYGKKQLNRHFMMLNRNFQCKINIL